MSALQQKAPKPSLTDLGMSVGCYQEMKAVQKKHWSYICPYFILFFLIRCLVSQRLKKYSKIFEMCLRFRIYFILFYSAVDTGNRSYWCCNLECALEPSKCSLTFCDIWMCCQELSHKECPQKLCCPVCLGHCSGAEEPFKAIVRDKSSSFVLTDHRPSLQATMLSR